MKLDILIRSQFRILITISYHAFITRTHKRNFSQDLETGIVVLLLEIEFFDLQNVSSVFFCLCQLLGSISPGLWSTQARIQCLITGTFVCQHLLRVYLIFFLSLPFSEFFSLYSILLFAFIFIRFRNEKCVCMYRERISIS